MASRNIVMTKHVLISFAVVFGFLVFGPRRGSVFHTTFWISNILQTSLPLQCFHKRLKKEKLRQFKTKLFWVESLIFCVVPLLSGLFWSQLGLRRLISVVTQKAGKFFTFSGSLKAAEQEAKFKILQDSITEIVLTLPSVILLWFTRDIRVYRRVTRKIHHGRNRPQLKKRRPTADRLDKRAPEHSVQLRLVLKRVFNAKNE